MSQKRNSLRTFAIVFGLFLAGIPLAFLLAGQFINEGGSAQPLIFLLFLAAWTSIGTLIILYVRMSAKTLYWCLHIALWLFAIVFGGIVGSIYFWFPGWLALLFSIGGSLLLATFYKPFMARFSGKTGPQPGHPYQSSYQQGYRPTLQNPVRYPEEDSAYLSHHEQPQANYPQGMTQQQ